MRFLLFLLLLPNITKPVDQRFKVSAIDDAFLENANMVVRYREGHFRIDAIDKAVFKERIVFTILNESARDHGLVAAPYDKLRKITSFSARIYDAEGNEIDRLKKPDIIDESNISGSELYDDARIRGADMRRDEYPYTIDFEYELSYNYLFQIPGWTIITDDNVSVEKSIFSVKAPISLTPRFKLINTDQQPTEISNEGTLTYRWEFENFPAQEKEPFSDRYYNNPLILVSPSAFKYEDYEGNMSTWDGLAKWIRSLNSGRNDLPEPTLREVANLVGELRSRKEKIKAIYEYMQAKTRYVSIQLGIGGYQPFYANLVDQVGYGDCKALSFYTQSLLESVGIESHYTLVHGGNNPPDLIDDFATTSSFNHVILCVPNRGDTLWLECTSQTNPTGYLGSFTGDRKALLITEDGGKIVRTPSYDMENNHTVTNAIIKLERSGDGAGEIDIRFLGQATDNRGISYYINRDDQEKKKWLQNFIDIPNYELISYHFQEKKDLMPVVKLKLDVAIRQIASTSEKRIILEPKLLNQKSYVPKRLKERKTPIVMRNAYMETDTITYYLPEGTFIEQPPKSAIIESEFGTYSTHYIIENNKLTYIRKMIRKKGEFPAELYTELVKFYRNIKRQDSRKIVISTET